jgi:hypothetical protein
MYVYASQMCFQIFLIFYCIYAFRLNPLTLHLTHIYVLCHSFVLFMHEFHTHTHICIGFYNLFIKLNKGLTHIKRPFKG